MRNKSPLHSKIDCSQCVMWSPHREDAQKWLRKLWCGSQRARIFTATERTQKKLLPVCAEVCHALQLLDSKPFNVCLHSNVISLIPDPNVTMSSIIAFLWFVFVIGLVIGFLSNNHLLWQEKSLHWTTAEPQWTLILWGFSHPFLVSLLLCGGTARSHHHQQIYGTSIYSVADEQNMFLLNAFLCEWIPSRWKP